MKKRIYLLMVLMVIVSALIISSLSASALKLNEGYSANGNKHEIVLVGVTEDESCIFKVDGKMVVVKEKEEEKYNGVYLWVKDAVVTHSLGENFCEVIIAFIDDIKIEKEEIGNNGDAEESEDASGNGTSESTLLQKAGEKAEKGLEIMKATAEDMKDAIANMTSNSSNFSLNSTDKIAEEMQDTPLKNTEKTIIQKFVEWLKGLFGIK